MDAPINPNRRRVYREEVAYEPVEPVVQPVVQPVYEQPVYQQPVVQPIVQQPVVQPVYQQLPVDPTLDARRTYSQVGDARMESVRQNYYDADGNLMEREEQVFDDPVMRRLNTLDRTAQIFYFIMGILELLLALRFLFRVLAADPTSGFANFIYGFTRPFVGPFSGIFNDQVLDKSGSVVEFSTLLAMLLYALVTYGIIQLLNIIFTPGRTTRQVYTTTRRRRY